LVGDWTLTAQSRDRFRKPEGFSSRSADPAPAPGIRIRKAVRLAIPFAIPSASKAMDAAVFIEYVFATA